MEGAFIGLAEKPLAELTSEMKLSAKQLHCLLMNTVTWKASCPKRRKISRHRGMETVNTEYQPDAAGRHTTMLMGIILQARQTRSGTN